MIQLDSQLWAMAAWGATWWFKEMQNLEKEFGLSERLNMSMKMA